MPKTTVSVLIQFLLERDLRNCHDKSNASTRHHGVQYGEFIRCLWSYNPAKVARKTSTRSAYIPAIQLSWHLQCMFCTTGAGSLGHTDIGV